jgi:hypothetical protein
MPRKPKEDGLIKFSADVHQVKTLVDGGIQITLDLSETETETAKKLMDCRRNSVVLQVVIMPIKPDKV